MNARTTERPRDAVDHSERSEFAPKVALAPEPEMTETPQGMNASDENSEVPHKITAVTLPDAFATKTANTLDIAAATILDRVRAVRQRCDRIERAVTDDIDYAKRQIHATIELATRAETLVNVLDTELDRIVQQRKNAMRD